MNRKALIEKYERHAHIAITSLYQAKCAEALGAMYRQLDKISPEFNPARLQRQDEKREKFMKQHTRNQELAERAWRKLGGTEEEHW